MYHPDDFPPHLQPVGPLGEGAFGRVHEALAADGTRLAVKVLASDDPDAAWRFDAEYRCLERLDDPGFPRAVERGQTPAGRPYYAMELIEGSPLKGLQPSAHEHLLAVARALAAAHATGWVHGDLKPENVVVTSSGRHVLLDVGLMAPIGARREQIAGTLEYLAPEAFRKAPVAAAADMYALGCLAYEWLTGQPPFRGTPAELVHAHLTQAPAAVDADGVMALLAKDPTRRPSAAMLLGRPAEPTLAGGAFIGRSNILSAWPAPWLEITGAPGQGKTRTLDELRLATPIPWVGVTCTPGDAPAGAARALVSRALALAGHAPSPALAAWLAGEVPPELADLEPAARKATLYTAAAHALAQAAHATGGLAIGLDDWQLADGASRDFLAYARREKAPISWAVASTEGEGLQLAPFTPEEAVALLTSRLGGAPPAGLAEALLPLAGGNPAALDALLEHVVARGVLKPENGQWRLQPGLALPADLAAVWSERWAALPLEARRLAAAAAAAAPAGELPLAWLAEAAGAGPEAAEALQAAGWLVGSRLASPALVEVALQGITAEERAVWSTRWARRLVAIGPAADGQGERHPGGRPAAESRAGDRTAAAAALALRGDDDALALALAEQAARAAMALAAPREAHALADAALARGSAPTLHLLRAEAARYLDRLPEAASDYEQALETGLPALIGLAKTRQMQGDYPAARGLLQQALALAEGATRARILSTLARLDLFAGEMASAEATAAEAAAIARTARNPAILAQCLTLHGLLRFQRDLGAADEARAVLEEALATSESIGDLVGQGMAHDALGNLATALGDLPRAAAAFARFGDLCRQAGLATEALMADLNAAIVAGEAHDAERAEALATDVAARARAVGRRFVLGAALAVVGQARHLRGQDASGPLDEALGLAEALENAVLETLVRMVRLEVAMGRPEAEQEAALLAELIARTGQEEAAGRLDGRLALLRRDPELARRRTTSRDQVAAHLAWRALAQLAPEEAVTAAEHALAIATAWGAKAHIEADRQLLVQALEATGRHAEARRLQPTATGVVDAARFASWMEDLAGGDVASIALNAVLDLARCTRGYVLTFEAGRLSAALTVGLDYGTEVEAGFSRSIAERALFTATPLYVVDAGADEAWRESQSVLALGLRTVLALPLAAGDRLLGVLYVDRDDPEPLLSDADVSLLSALASAAAALMASQREARALEIARDAEARCARLARALHRSPGTQTLLAAAKEAAGADEARWLERPWGEGVSHSIADHVAETGKPLCLLDAGNSEDFQAGGSVLALGLKTVWCLPVPGTQALLYLAAERVEDDDRGLAVLAALAAYYAAW